MAGPAPVLRIKGKVHTTRERQVPAMPARDAVRDESGRITAPAYEAREGYDVVDVTILTDGGGFVTVVFRDEAITDAGGYCPGSGDSVDVPVRAFDNWRGNPGHRYRVNGYSFAGSVYAEEHGVKSGGGARALSPASQSA